MMKSIPLEVSMAWIARVALLGLAGTFALRALVPTGEGAAGRALPAPATEPRVQNAPSPTRVLDSSVPPAQQPLLEGGDLRFLGTITLPENDGHGVTLTYGGHALGMSGDGQSLYYSCVYGVRAARVSLPDVGGRATLLEPCVELDNLNALDPTDPNAKRMGGLLAWNGRLILSGYAVYDAGRMVTRSHWAGPNIANAKGPFAVGNELPGLLAGYMGVVPEDWRPLLGGPALTGQCCISIISRSSYGPAAAVFDPDEVGVKPKAAAKLLVGYPDDHQGLGAYDRANEFFSSASMVGGIAFPSGTRSVLFIGRHGSTYCYGEGTKDMALHMKPHPLGTSWCYDPSNSDKGTHGFPYRHMVWAYDANDLAAVKQGRKSPWDVKPYSTWTLTEMSGGTGHAAISGAVYDPQRRRLYVVATNDPVLYVYGLPEIRLGQ